MENQGASHSENFLRKAMLVLLCIMVLAGRMYYRLYQNYMNLNVLEFRLSHTRLELPCTVDDIRACGYQVDTASGQCKYQGLDLAHLYITTDENGIVYEIYTDDLMCNLEIYGNISMGQESLKESGERIKKAYGKPAEENGNTKTYIKYKTETEYAYVVKTGVIISRIGIVADKPSNDLYLPF